MWGLSLDHRCRRLAVFPGLVCHQALLLVVLLSASGVASADVVRLKSGGEVRGQLRKAGRSELNREVRPSDLALISQAGIDVVVAAEEVQFSSRRSPLIEEYESRAKRVLRTAEGHWELAEWCRKSYLSAQRTSQLQLVLAFDPEHEGARKGLGHVHAGGVWVDRDGLMAAKGYHKYKGKYVTQQELDLVEKTEAELGEEKEWYGRVKQWVSWLGSHDPQKRQQGYVALQRIDRPAAASAITRFVSESTDAQLRELGIQCLGRLSGPKPVRGLVRRVLTDPELNLRDLAREALKPDQYEAARVLFEHELRNLQNVVVGRAAFALGGIGERKSVGPLIDALVTRHQFRVFVPDGNRGVGVGVAGGGSFGNTGVALPPEIELQLRTGQLPYGVNTSALPAPKMREVIVEREVQNEPVLAALTKITGQGFGFDQRVWRLWWAAEQQGALVKP